MYERTSVCLLCASREGSGRANLQPAEPRTQQDTHKATEMGWGCTRYKEGKKLHASLAPSRVKKLGIYLVRLFAERAPLSEARLAARRLAQHLHAPSALHDRLGVAEHRRNGKAPRALHVHEERVGRLYQPLQLVLLGLDRGVGVQQVTLESLRSTHTQIRSAGYQARTPRDKRCK